MRAAPQPLPGLPRRRIVGTNTSVMSVDVRAADDDAGERRCSSAPSPMPSDIGTRPGMVQSVS